MYICCKNYLNFNFSKQAREKTNYRNICLRLNAAPSLDLRRYNTPTSSQVGALILDNNSGQAKTRDVILHAQNGRLQMISEIHSAYDPCQYPVLFPFGSSGWYPDAVQLKRSNRYVTARQYTRYRLQVNSDGIILDTQRSAYDFAQGRSFISAIRS